MQTFQPDQTNQAPKIGFDPHAMSFGGGLTNRKTFSSLGGQQNDSIFAQNTQFGQQNQQPTLQAGINPQQSTPGGLVFGQNSSIFSN